MRRAGPGTVLAVFGLFALASATGIPPGPGAARAQMPETGLEPGRWDRWDPAWMEREIWAPGRMRSGLRQRMARHRAFMHQGTPEAYRGAGNPLPPDPGTIAEGRALYLGSCASCHGADGTGKGSPENSLNPSPALLAYLIQMPKLVDEYMLWSISDGGKEFGSPMPAFKDRLTRDQIWKIVIFLRAGFPDDRDRPPR